ncbi:hypothetical protein FBU30_009487 [Linnemannia zychae]|nr:hypothetical protein FBU30_009487 [Linnemannia zychae]
METDSTIALQGDIEILRQELLNMEAKRDALRRQIEEEERNIQHDATPPIEEPPVPTAKDELEQKRLQDILMAYRLTGVTLFNGDEFNQQDWSQYGLKDIIDSPKDAGIRFDTFALRKYYEPYYVMLSVTPKARRASPQDNDEADIDIRKSIFEITKHTIPHWVPLRELEKRYLNRDMSTFTRLVSDYLQAYVTRRENLSQVVKTFTLDDTLIQVATSSVEGTTATTTTPPGQGPISIPQISCLAQDAAVRDITLHCFRYDVMFKLYHLHLAREKQKRARNETTTKSGIFLSATSNTPNSTVNIDKPTDNHDLEMDIDGEDNDSEEHREREECLGLLKSTEPIVSAKIHLVYGDLQSTLPARVNVQFLKGNYPIQLDSLPVKDPLRLQHSQWVKILSNDFSLYNAILNIADLKNT